MDRPSRCPGKSAGPRAGPGHGGPGGDVADSADRVIVGHFVEVHGARFRVEDPIGIVVRAGEGERARALLREGAAADRAIRVTS